MFTIASGVSIFTFGILSFNTGFAIWVLISMIVFLYLMGKYAVPHIVKALDNREEQIKNSLEAADKALAKAEQVSKDNKKALKDAEIQAQKIRKDALDDAEVLRSKKIENAKKEAAKIVNDAKATIEQEKKSALVELRNEVSELAIKSASLIIKQELDEEKNQKLVNDFIKDLSKN